MIFVKSITATVGQDEANPVIQDLVVCKGLVYRIEFDFPPGCCGLLHVRIFDGSYQVYPTSRDDSFHGDASTIAFDDCYLKNIPPWTFRIVVWNNDDTWPHTVQIRMGIAASEAFMSRYMPSVSWNKFNELLAEAAIEQEKARQEAIAETFKELGFIPDEVEEAEAEEAEQEQEQETEQ